jgi:phosphoglycolate phosphatase
MELITIACLDMAGTTVADDDGVITAFAAAIERGGLARGTPAHDRAMQTAQVTMGQSKIEVFRQIFTGEADAQRANAAFEECYAAAVAAGQVEPVPGAAEVMSRLREAGIRVCLATGFAPATRDAVIDALGWRPLADLLLSPADAGRGRPWPDMPLTALLRLGGGAVSELAVVGDTPSDIESGRRAGAGLVAGVLTGDSSREELEQAKAHAVIGSVTGLPALLGLDG